MPTYTCPVADKGFFKLGLILLVLLYVAHYESSAQTLPVGTPLLEETARRLQVTGKRSLESSFMLRPLHVSKILSFDSLYHPIVDSASAGASRWRTFAGGKGKVLALPVQLRQQFNGRQPYGWNDGAMIPAKGYQALFTAGVYAQLGPLTIQLQPEAVLAQNASFVTFPGAFSDSVWYAYYKVLNRIDAPERFGSGTYTRLFPGQSSIRLHHKKLSAGFSTENLWWGPGERVSLLMSNNAPGFAHFTFNTTAPVRTGIGSFEWQLVAGNLQESGLLPPDTSRTFEGTKLYQPKPEGKRYLNALALVWQPKWTPGLYLGVNRVFYQYAYNRESSLNGYLPVIGALFKSNSRDENSYGRDQMLSLSFRLVLPESRTEMYGEFARNDHSLDQRDFILQPEHARAYMLGARKYFTIPKKNTDFSLFIEITQLQKPSTLLVRELESWYTHYQVRHGYTHRGQVLGAGIGPGGSSQTAGLAWYKGIQRTSITFERVVHNNDFYYDAFRQLGNFSRHWVDLSLALARSWERGRFIYNGNLSIIRSYNYQWRVRRMIGLPKDVNNLQAAFSIGYRF